MREKKENLRGMTWDYRVIKSESGFHVHEVYYNLENEDTPKLWTEKEVGPEGNDFEGIVDDLGFYIRAFSLPVLEIYKNKLRECKSKR
jgi:hypothetical protein